MIATHKRVSGNLVFIPMNSGNKAGDNLVPRHYKPPSPVSHLPPQQEPPLRPPECFSGDPQKIISFLTQCCIQFRLQSSAFPMEESKTLAFSCKWDSQALMDMFYCGLSEKVKDEMAARDPPPDLNRLVEMAVRIDCQIQPQLSVKDPLNGRRRYFSKVPEDYLDLKEVFSKVWATSLPPHRPYDCAIDLVPGITPPCGRLYSVSTYLTEIVLFARQPTPSSHLNLTLNLNLSLGPDLFSCELLIPATFLTCLLSDLCLFSDVALHC
ncbi:hypothetical protein QTP86_009794 [Hemibagrus guttatus]|nr:hypothetical protein QTP86_009794 [Hemibagrus guttatus]